MNNFHTRFAPPPSGGLRFTRPSLVQKQFKKESDINYLVGRFTKTGSFYTPEQLAKVRATPQYGDFTAMQAANVVEAHATIARAREAFEALPYAIRERFGHSPENLLAFLQNPENRAEAEKLGLVVPKKVEEAAPTPAPTPAPVPTPGKGTENKESQPSIS